MSLRGCFYESQFVSIKDLQRDRFRVSKAAVTCKTFAKIV